MSDRPLLGRRVVVTRQPEQAGELRRGLEAMGAVVVEVPVIEIAPPLDVGPLDAALSDRRGYDWVVFTSANAVRAVAERLRACGRSWSGAAVASVGPATTAAVRKNLPTAEVSLEPSRDHRAEGLLASFAGQDLAGRRVLVPLSDRARDVVAAGLRALGAQVDVVTSYRNVPAPGLSERVAAALAEGADVVTFASPSAVERFVAAVPRDMPLPAAAVIGPVTEQAARQAGLPVVAVAAPSTVDGMLDAISRFFAS